MTSQLLAPPTPLLEFPAACTTASVAELLHSIEKLHVCQGAGSLPVDALKVQNAFVDNVPTPVKEAADMQMQTLRDDQCALLVPTNMTRCQNCKQLKERQRQKVLRKSRRDETSSNSCFTPNTYLSSPQKLQKLANMAVLQSENRKKINALKSRIEAMYKKDGILVDQELHQDLLSIAGESRQALPIGSANSFGISSSKLCRTKTTGNGDGTHSSSSGASISR